MSKKISTHEDLLNAKCPSVIHQLYDLEARSQVNFKCTNKDCSKLYSEKVLRDNGYLGSFTVFNLYK